MAAEPISFHPVTGIPLVSPGDDLAALLLDALRRTGSSLEAHDIVIVAQKIVSKAEDRFVDLRQVVASPRAHEIAAIVGKEPALVEVVLGESRSVVRAAPRVLIVETLHGFVCANAGVDHSNVSSDRHQVLLLPSDPDESARRIRLGMERACGVPLACLVIDSHGRPWREGTVGVAIGADGIGALHDYRGRRDLFDRELLSSTEGVIDELASAASLLMGQANEAVPVVIARGYSFSQGPTGAQLLQRPPERDLFR